MNGRGTLFVIGGLLITIGVFLVLLERIELSIACPFGGETPNVADYCLTHENYYLTLFLSGVFSVIAGIAFLAFGAIKSVKVIAVPNKNLLPK